MTVLDLDYNFASLSLHDLLEARDTYHYHLLSKANVVGTAIGLYLIRKGDPWPTSRGDPKAAPAKTRSARTLGNSEVRDYSWPCILAFVREWAHEREFGPDGAYNPAQIIPKTLYLPDGRAVPVCVVEAPPARPEADDLATLGPRASHTLGGGSPILVQSQGETRRATSGGLVTDGHTVYALTARHACGEPGQPILSQLREGLVQVGQSSSRQLTRLAFSEVYPDFPGRRSFCALDIGLVRVDTIADWTSNTYGLPAVGPMADLNERNLSLRLIDQPVIGYGAASGLISGRVKALFYRHRSVGGFDYVGDFLIASDEARATRPGDSGMVWHLDVTPGLAETPDLPLAVRDLRPLAVEWGGQVFDESGRRETFAVATSLSSVCRLLDVELLTDVNRGVSGYWGRTGHYSIAALAIGLVRDPKLKKLMSANAEILSFELSDIAQTGFDKSVGKLSAADKFVPLADVPDEIWKKLPKSKGGREGGRDNSGGQRSNGPEHPNHYADIDAPYPPHGKSLRALCLKDPAQYLTVPAWRQFYRDMAEHARQAGDASGAAQYASPLKQGLLPFRLWQFFDAMKAFVEAGDIEGYVTAAGISAHYMGDASQPLHGSVLADGDRSRLGPRQDKDGKLVPFGDGVHSAFETAMVSRFAAALLPRAETIAQGLKPLTRPASGAQVALSVIELMEAAAQTLAPADILEAFERSGGDDRVAHLQALYAEVGEPTAKLLALGAQALANLWDAAWAAGNGGATAASSLKAQAPQKVRARYIRTDFIPSLTLDAIQEVLKP